MKTHLFLASVISIAAAGCDLRLPSSSTSTRGGEASGRIHMWIGADKDTYASCGRTASCEEGDLNFAEHGTLVVSGNQQGRKVAYVHFLLPEVPRGTVVETAYLELFHPGPREDGQTDDIRIPVTRAAAPFDPHAVTWNNQPNSFPASRQFLLDLESQDWSGSSDIAPMVQDLLDDPGQHTGFVLYWDDASLGIEKGFYSINDTRRRAGDLGLSPRLMVRMVLPDGTSTADITLPPFPPDTDLGMEGQEVLMNEFRGGLETWPAAWDVTGP